MGVPAGPGVRELVRTGPLEGMVEASSAGVPGGAGLDSPVVCLPTPIGLRGHIETEWLGGALPVYPNGVWSVARRSVDFTGQRWLSVVAISVGRVARVGEGGIETLWTWRGCRTGACTGSRKGGSGGGRWSSARSPGQGAVTHRDTVEALS